MDNVEKTELTAAEKLAQMEKEKLTRRQALARFGFQAGAAAVAALTADELLRKVGTEMQRRAGDNKVAQQVAKELNQAGVANAAFAILKPGDEGFVPTDLCGEDCISNCKPNIGFSCSACYFLCNGLQYPNKSSCASSGDCQECCNVQYRWCLQKGSGLSACASLLTQCQQNCF